MNQANLDHLRHWIKERQAIYDKRAAGQPPPWTTDPILANYRFTNVHREDDKVTKWIALYWRNIWLGHRSFTAGLVLARMLNNPDCLKEIGYPDPWDAEYLKGAIKKRRATGLKILNAAYLITTCGVSMDKVDYIVRVANDVFTAGMEPKGGQTLASFHSELMSIKGLGQFLAAQVVADAKNTPGCNLETAPDWWTWAAPGPGSRRGLEAVLGRPVPLGHFLGEASALKKLVPEAEGLCMQDFQNCLCEISKYLKAVHGIGTPKQRYLAG
jgi:hypothetical protein